MCSVGPKECNHPFCLSSLSSFRRHPPLLTKSLQFRVSQRGFRRNCQYRYFCLRVTNRGTWRAKCKTDKGREGEVKKEEVCVCDDDVKADLCDEHHHRGGNEFLQYHAKSKYLIMKLCTPMHAHTCCSSAIWVCVCVSVCFSTGRRAEVAITLPMNSWTCTELQDGPVGQDPRQRDARSNQQRPSTFLVLPRD